MTDKKTELILKIETKLIDTNTAQWEAEQKAFLAELTNKFETDEDFVKAENELKEIEAREKAARVALNEVVNGSKDIAELTETVESIIEDLRQARLSHAKIIKSEKESRKNAVVETAVGELKKAYDVDTPIGQAMKIRMPFDAQVRRIYEATKSKRSIDGIQKGVNAEMTAIKAEMMSEAIDLKTRYELLPSDKMHLFSDVVNLIAGNSDLSQVINERLDAEQARIKAQAEAEEKRKAEAEKARIKAEEKAQAEMQEAQQISDTPPEAKSEQKTPEETAKFALIIETTQAQAVALARQLKAQYPTIELKKL